MAGHRGFYRVDVYLNGALLTTRDIAFRANQQSADGSGLRACLTPEMLNGMNVNISAFPQLAKAAAGDCVDLAAAIPAASSVFLTLASSVSISVFRRRR